MKTVLAAGLLGLTVAAALAAACGPYGDAASYARAARRERARRAAAMAEATRTTPRGRALAGDELARTVSGRTWVSRYDSFPNGSRGKYVLYRSFRPDGRFVATDNFLSSRVDANGPDTWKVDGPRLCILWSSFDSAAPHCYRIARSGDGALQAFIDEPGSELDGLLTFVVREVLDGPAPEVPSVLETPGA